MLKKMKKKPLPIALFSVTITLMVLFSVLAVSFSTIYFILIGAAVGLFSYLLSSVVNKSKEEKK